MKALGAIAAVVLVSACQHEHGPPDTGLAGFDPNMIENQTRTCLDGGGRFGVGGSSGAFVCFHDTRDANRRCTASSDCEGLCLARSGTCAPVTPLFGCHEVLGRLGARSTLCIE